MPELVPSIPVLRPGSRVARATFTVVCALLVLFLARNSLNTFLFGARGWGLSIPPSLVREIAAFGPATESASRVYLSTAERYPLSERRVLLRRDHRLAMQSREELALVWGQRVHSLAATSLIGRQVYGLSWYTTPALRLPTEFQVETAGTQPLRVVALRVLPRGREELDRSGDSILCTEVASTEDEVSVDLWFSNPMRDARGAAAHLAAAVLGDDGQRLALAVPERGERWVLRFPLGGGGPRQLRDGRTEVAMAPLRWLERGGGLLSLTLRLGRERPRSVSLANATIVDGKIARLDRFENPVALRLWGHDDRPREKLPPDLSTLEGTLVQASAGFAYLVSGGRRHWVPDPASLGGAEVRALSPGQLWMIPPGLPWSEK